MSLPASNYIGRFAPSPTGPLHMGSLVCALASYLDAKRHRGQWLVRMEDIDPPREVPGAAHAILTSLRSHGLLWDGEVRWQSERTQAYQTALTALQERDLLYPCTCTRKRLTPLGGRYDGYCRHHPPTGDQPAALRVKVTDADASPTHQQFTDRIVGLVQEDLAQTVGDFVVHRKDGFFAYQLAVVVDDIDQQISHVVRGDDLLSTTTRYLYLYHCFRAQAPSFAHIPVVRDARGLKLSKQNHAPALDDQTPVENLLCALKYLDIHLPQTQQTHPQDILQRASEQLKAF